MPLILNIETATDVGSVCISKGNKILVLKESTSPFSHAKETTLLIAACLKEAQLQMNELEAVAVSRGPGSYTALRVGFSVAKGICYALDIPLIGVDTLCALALAASKVQHGDWYIPMIDARRMEVYTAFFDKKMNCFKAAHALVLDKMTFAFATEQEKQIVFAGNGSKKFQQIVEQQKFIFADLKCSAAHLVPLAYQSYQFSQFESLAYSEPSYLKPPNITKPKKRL